MSQADNASEYTKVITRELTHGTESLKHHTGEKAHKSL